MFAITSTRIAGLVAAVCAVVVAPQALGAPSAHTRVAPPDGVQGYDLSGFDLSALNMIPGYQEQQEYLAALAAGSHKSGTASTKAAASKAAAIKALLRRSADLNAAYRKLYPGAYVQAAQKSDNAGVWRFPAFCNGLAQAEYDFVYPGCQG